MGSASPRRWDMFLTHTLSFGAASEALGDDRNYAFLRQCGEESAVSTPYEQRTRMENILVFLLASIEPGEQF